VLAEQLEAISRRVLRRRDHQGSSTATGRDAPTVSPEARGGRLRRLRLLQTAAAALLQATSLSFLVVAGQIGVQLDLIRPATYAALVAAGLLSVLLFPLTALRLLCGAERKAEPEHSYPLMSGVRSALPPTLKKPWTRKMPARRGVGWSSRCPRQTAS
jgi:hypothetical protein